MRFNADPTIADLLSQDTFLSTEGTIFTSSSFDSLGTGGYSARAINANSIEPVSNPVTLPAPSSNASTQIPWEGGPISIKSILAPLDSSVEKLAANSELTKAPAKSLLRSAPEKLAESPQAAASVREIYGEWARAAVFEIAGGEPLAESRYADESHSQPDAASAQHATERLTEPSAFTDAKLNGWHRRESDPTAQTTEPVSANAHDNASIHPTLGIRLPSAIVGADYLALSQLAVPWNERASRNGNIAKPADSQPEEAVAAAFDQIGDDELALTSPSTDRLRLNSWLSGTPLLLLFALERAAARNSRRQRQTEGSPK